MLPSCLPHCQIKILMDFLSGQSTGHLHDSYVPWKIERSQCVPNGTHAKTSGDVNVRVLLDYIGTGPNNVS